MRGLAANPETGHVESTTDEPTLALVGHSQLAQGRTALARALPYDAHEAGSTPVVRVFSAQLALCARSGRQTHGAVALLVAAATFRVINERVATRVGATRARAEGLALELRRRQVFGRAAALDRIRID